jgi:uncharacterized protein
MYTKLTLSETMLKALCLFPTLTTEHHIREVARLMSISPRTAQLTLEALEERGALISRTRGRNRVYRLQKAGWRYVLLAEHYKTISFLETHPHLERVLDPIEGIGIIYGSYAKGTETRSSDLDLFIAGTGTPPKRTGIRIQTTTYPLEAFERGIATDAYLREVIEHRVVISGAEALVRMIMDARLV